MELEDYSSRSIPEQFELSNNPDDFGSPYCDEFDSLAQNKSSQQNNMDSNGLAYYCNEDKNKNSSIEIEENIVMPTKEWQSHELTVGPQHSTAVATQSPGSSSPVSSYQQFKAKTMKTQPYETMNLLKTLNECPLFYFTGNIIIDLREDSYITLASNSISREGESMYSTAGRTQRIGVCRDIKRISQIEDYKSTGEICVSFSLNVKPIQDVAFVSHVLSRFSGHQLAADTLHELTLYQQSNAMKYQQAELDRIIQKAENAQIDMKECMLKRQEIMKRYQEELIRKYCGGNGMAENRNEEERSSRNYSNESFYIASHYMSDFASLEQNQKNFIYSYAFLALLGLSSDQFAQCSSKKGISMWLSMGTRSRLVIELMRDWNSDYYGGNTTCEGESKSEKSKDYSQGERVSIIDEFTFKTIDDIQVTCKVKRVRKRVCMSEYFGEIAKGAQIFDQVTLLLFEIDVFQIKRILEFRRDYELYSKATLLINDVEYDVQSQLFLEKYYSNVYVDYTQMQSLLEKKNKQKEIDELRTCKYKIIRNDHHFNY